MSPPFPGPPPGATPPTARGTAPCFTVILPTRNRLRSLQAAVAALRRQTLPPGEVELVVVEDGCTDGTPAFLEAEASAGGLRVLHTPGLGPAGARNAALAAARGELLAFTDDDCVMPPDWLERLRAALAPGGPDAVGGGVRNAAPALLSQVYQDMAGFFYEAHNREPGRARFLTTNNFACRRAAVGRAGGFDPRFHLGGSDRELVARMLDAGLRVEYRPGISVDHHHHYRLGSFLKHLFRQGQGSHLRLRVVGRGKAGVERVSPGTYVALLRYVARGHGVAGGSGRAALAMLGQAAVVAGYLAAAAGWRPRQARG